MTSALVLLATLSLVAPVRGGEGTGRSQAYSHYLLAKQALAANDYPRAIDEFAQARDLDPASAVVRAELAEVYLRLRRYKEAVREAERAVEIDPASESALDLLARLYESTGDPDKALATLRRLADLSPDDAGNLVRMAVLKDRVGKTEEAVKLLEEAVARDPRSTEAVFELVERFRLLGRLDRAIETLESAAQADPSNLYLQSKLAEFYLQVRDRRKAATALDRMATIEPRDAHVLLEVARAFRQMGDHARAAALYRTARGLEPEDESIRVNLATALAQSGEYAEAMVEYRALLAALEAMPGAEARGADRFEFLKRIGILEMQLGNVEGALEALSRARTLAASDDIEIVRILARAYELAGKPAEGLALLGEAIRGKLPDERHRDLFLTRAALLILAGQVDEGLALYRQLDEAQKLAADQHAYVAYVLYRVRREKEAERVLEAAVAADPAEERATRVHVANLLLDARETGLALALAEKLVARYPQEREVYLYLSRAQSRLGDQESAAEVLRRAVDLFPEDADLRFQLGATYERLKRFADSGREIEAAISLEPSHALALNYLAYMLAERGEALEKALQYAQRAIALEPGNGAYLDTLGWTHFKLGNLDLARRYLLEAVGRLGDDPVVRDHLGDVLSRLGEHQGSLEQYQRALDLRSPEPPAGLKDKIERERRLVEAGAAGAERKPAP